MITLQPNKTVAQHYEDLFRKYLDGDYNEKPITGGGGRTYPTPKDLAEKSVEYFVARYATGLPPTLESYRVYMHFFSKQAFYKYKHEVKQYQPDFGEIIDIVRLLVEAETADGLFNKNLYPGSRFILQCGYQDWIPTEKVINENHDISVTIGGPEPIDE